MILRKKMWLLVISGVLLTVGTAPSLQAEGINWQSDFGIARQTARQQGKPLLVHFWSESCGPCKKLDQYVFPHPDVARSVNEVIAVKVNTREQRRLAQQFGIKRIPTDVLLAPDGRELGRGISPSTVNAYIAMVKRAVHLQQNSRDRTGLSQLADISRQRDPYLVGQTGYASDNGTRNPAGFGADSQHSQPANAGGVGSGRNAEQRTQNSDLAGSGSFQPRGGEFQDPRTKPDQSNRNTHQTPRTNTADANAAQRSEDRSPSDNPYFGGAGSRGHARPNPQPSASNSGQVQQSVAKPKFALDGFCPVSLVEKRRWTKGDPRWGVVHRGQTYVFASEANAKKFWTDPDAFSPMLSGFDPVKFAEQRQWIVGKRQFGVFYKDENSGKTSIVLFADEGALQRFWTDPKRYSGQVQQALQLNGQSHLR
jgi:thiol-disulfide isomerase/thioredoxin/YHS domain-containing protein